jgi:restriction system protein
MGRQTAKTSGAAQWRRQAAVALVALGGALVLLPLFLGFSPLTIAIAPFYPAGLLLVIIGAVLVHLNSRQPDKVPTARPTAWGAAVFEVIERPRFEALVEALFEQAGFETKSQTDRAGQRVGLWLYSSGRPDRPVGLVQCKHWYGKPVGVDRIRELRVVMAAKSVQRGFLATTSTFTDEAGTFARGNGIALLDVERLLETIAKRSPEQQRALLDVALDGALPAPALDVPEHVAQVQRERKSQDQHREL